MAQYLDLQGVQTLWDKVKNWVRSYARLTSSNGVYTLHVGDNETTLAPSDEKVQQVATTTGNNYAILLKNTTGVDGVTAGVRFGSKTNYLITANPGTGTITAKNFSGTATQATADGSGNTITSTYATKAEITQQMRYMGAVDELPSSNGSNIKVGDVYVLKSTREEFMAISITSDEKLYYNLSAVGGGSATISGNIDTSVSNTGIKTEAQLAQAVTSTSDQFSSYPLISSTYVSTPLSATTSNEIMYRLVPVQSSKYGLTLVLVTRDLFSGVHKAYALRNGTDGGLNSISGTLYLPEDFADVTNGYPSSAGIRTFFVFGGGVQWERIGSTDISGKADKVVGATSGNFATLTADGNLADSGVSAAGSALTDTMVTQTATTTSASYPILFKESTATSTVTGTARFGSGVTVNPSTKTVTATNFAGKANGLTLTQQSTGFTIAGGTTSRTLTVGTSYTLGAACAKGVASSFSASSTDLPTCAAVANYVSDQMTGTATFQSVISSNSTISGSAYKKGWYWIVGTAGTYVAVDCEAGDYIYAIADKVTSYNTSDFKVVQGNITPISATDIANLSND